MAGLTIYIDDKDLKKAQKRTQAKLNTLDNVNEHKFRKLFDSDNKSWYTGFTGRRGEDTNGEVYLANGMSNAEIRKEFPGAFIKVENGVKTFRLPKVNEEPINSRIEISYNTSIKEPNYEYVVQEKKLPLSGYNYNNDHEGEGSIWSDNFKLKENYDEYKEYLEDVYRNLTKNYIHLKTLKETKDFLSIYGKFPRNTIEYNGYWDKYNLNEPVSFGTSKESGYYPRPEAVFLGIPQIGEMYGDKEKKYVGFYIPKDFFIEQRNKESKISRLVRTAPLTIDNSPTYNITTYQNGGPTHLQPLDEQRFMMWFNTLPEGIRNSNDYDYRGWWLENGSVPYKQILSGNGHFTDKYKLPNHPTFSNQSIYSKGNTIGGQWINNDMDFVPSQYNVRNGSDRIVDYMEFGDKGSRMFDTNGMVAQFKDGGQTGLTIFIDDEQFKKGGQIHIKEKNKGKFTKQAQSAGMSVQEFARHVLAHKDRYPASTVKRANFARNASKWGK